VVTRTFNDPDPVGRVASEVLERALKVSLDNYDFDQVMKCLRDDYLLFARGVPWVRYVPTFGQAPLDEAAEPLEMPTSGMQGESADPIVNAIKEMTDQPTAEGQGAANEIVTDETKQAMKRALTALEAILVKLPAEVRGKIGGFASLSQLTTDEARAKFLKGRVEKMDKVFETWLRKEYLSRIREIFRQSKAEILGHARPPMSDDLKVIGRYGPHCRDLTSSVLSTTYLSLFCHSA
jgi:hypothetical protein